MTRTRTERKNPHLPLPDNGDGFGGVAAEDHVVSLGQDQPLRPDVHLVLHRRLGLPQVDPCKGCRTKTPIIQVVRLKPALVNPCVLLLGQDEGEGAALGKDSLIKVMSFEVLDEHDYESRWGRKMKI